MTETSTRKIQIESWFLDSFALIKKLFKFNSFNLLYLLLICIVCFSFLQFATSSVSKCFIDATEFFINQKYIAPDNLMDCLKMPLVPLLLIIYIIVISNIVMFQIGLFIYIFEQSNLNKKANVFDMINFSLKGIKKLIYPKNWLIFVFVLLILPFADILSFSYFNYSLAIPGFILDVIKSKLVFAIPYYVVSTIVVILAILSVFSFHHFFLEDISYRKAWMKSAKYFIKKLPVCLLVTAIVFSIAFIAILLFSFIIVLLTDVLRRMIFLPDLFVEYVLDLTGVLFTFISLPLLFSIITCIIHLPNAEENCNLCNMHFKQKKKIGNSVIIFSIVAILALIDVGLNIKNYDVYNTKSEQPITIAHRGSSIDAPENSIPAFQLAIDQGADMIELDVHQTKDEVLIISHDDSLKRIAGLDKYVYDYTYDEISKFDVGSWYSKDFSYLRIATLEEVFQLTKDKIELVIEIKPTSHDINLEEKLLDLIYKYDMKNQVMIHSLKTAPLIKIHELDSSINIAYCMFLALGNIDTIEWADSYTVEESNITPELVRKVHQANKKIYAWTINRGDNIQYLIDCGIDGLIGDNIPMLKENIEAALYNKGFGKFLRMTSLKHFVM